MATSINVWTVKLLKCNCYASKPTYNLENYGKEWQQHYSKHCRLNSSKDMEAWPIVRYLNPSVLYYWIKEFDIRVYAIVQYTIPFTQNISMSCCHKQCKDHPVIILKPLLDAATWHEAASC